MKASGNLGSEKMPIILDQPDTDPNPGSQGNFSILDLVQKPSEYMTERNFSETIQLEVSELGTEQGHKALEGENKKDWNLKYVPDLFQGDKMSSFSCSGFRGKENSVKDEPKKCKKKQSKFISPVSVQEGFQNSDAQEVLITKQLKSKQIAVKGKKSMSRLKEKINGIKKNYKPIAPYPVADDQKIVVHSHVQKLLSPQVNPILIVKIDDQRFNEDKTKIPEYLEFDKKLEDSECALPNTFNPQQKDSTSECKDKKNYVTKSKCYKCYNCPFMTLNKDYLNFHFQKRQKCYTNTKVFHCPGCKNVFYSLTPLKVHLIHDHRMLSREVKTTLQNMQGVRFEMEKEKSTCAFESSQVSNMAANVFAPAVEIPLNAPRNREDLDKNFNGLPEKLSESRVPDPCGSGKKPTMLESYLDDINNKGECSLPPSLNHNGNALLENTFNFAAPGSDQLPSIQPPTAHSSSNSILDQSHLVVDHQSHSFIGMANVFDGRDQVASIAQAQPDSPIPSQNLSAGLFQSAFKQSDPPHYADDTNMMLSNGNYLQSHIQDIPVINIEENNLEKSSGENILTHEIAMEDFSSYDGNCPGSLEMEENDCPLPAEDEDQEEKKKLKKLGVGFRCDINGCKVRLQSEKNIQYHRRCHEGTLYNCPECCKDCSTWVSLSSHLWQAHKIDMELYKCDQCPYKTPSYSRLTNIHRGIHGKARPFLCDICGKGFKTVKQMRNHKNIHKAKMVRMSACHCEICGRTVADKRQLELHINNTHKKKKPYLCYMCGYASAVKHSLVVHMRRHTGEKPYQCEKCEYKTADHNALRRHKMKHSGVRSYKCNHCSYTCIQASTYKVHIKTKHPGLETDVIFSCGQCNFQTLNRGSFLSHTSEHDNFSEEVRKPERRSQNSKTEVPTNDEYYVESHRIDLVGPIISERVVETIVDLSGAQSLLEHDDYYDVERITGDLDEAQELKFKTSGIT